MEALKLDMSDFIRKAVEPRLQKVEAIKRLKKSNKAS
jgi:hypothetical protein